MHVRFPISNCRDLWKSYVEAVVQTPEPQLLQFAGGGRETSLALVLLLDQFSRNIYRGPASKFVFTQCDPLARTIAKSAYERVFDMAEKDSYKRTFFYLPLMHAEDVNDNRLCVDKHQQLVKDVADNEEAKKFAELGVKFAQDHLDIIKQFGRYPHRNAALEREPTEAEISYLANGGQVF